MSREHRVTLAIALSVCGALGLTLFGGQVQLCLGPLDVTAVQCYAASGRVPATDASTPIGVLLIGFAALLVAPPPRRAWPVALLAGVVTGALAALAYATFRARTIEGPGSTGSWFVVPLPLDPNALAAFATAGVFTGSILAGVVLSAAALVDRARTRRTLGSS